MNQENEVTKSLPPGRWRRMRQLTAHTGLSRSLIYALIAAGIFPPPIKLSYRVAIWDIDAVDAWIVSGGKKVAA
jgi:prophage regulatory protein